MHAQLGVDGALAQPERRTGIRGRANDGRDDVGWQPRWRGEDRLLEVGALERVRLVEDREQLERAGAQETLNGHLGAGHVALDQERPLRVLPGLGEDRANPRRRRRRGLRIVRPDHAAARRQRERLYDAGKPDLGGDRRRVVARADRAMLGLRHSGGGERAPHRGLVARRGRGLRRVAGESQPLGRERGHAHSLVVNGHHRVERALLRQRRDRLRGRLRPAQVERQLVVAHRHEPPLGRHHDLGAERPGGGEEVGRPVAGRRQQEEQASHAGIVGPGR